MEVRDPGPPGLGVAIRVYARAESLGTPQVPDSFFDSTKTPSGIVLGCTIQKPGMDKTIHFTLNDRPQTISVDIDRTLLEVLREDLALTGTKYGCGEGQCGACTVLVDGHPIRSCVRSAEFVDGKKVTTIEGLERDGQLHPVQEIFLSENAFQCGYCTSGMILGVVGALQENPRAGVGEVMDRMNRHICRCCGYPNIARAIRRAVARTGE